ncbi:MAG: hypothetical protein Q4B91_05765 [Atopobiaceae bacterium]|nr:hypothetical protein [Atopobiaceae bacterium]
MPAILTHDLFGRGVLEDATSLLNLRTPAERDAFLLGNQGPDPLFYLTIDPLMHKWSPLGNALHASAPAEVLLAMREAALRLEGRERQIARAYVAGFACHWLLDSTIHPFVYFWQNGICSAGVPGLDESARSRVHAEIERDFDEMALYALTGRTVERWRPHERTLAASRATLAAIDKLYFYAALWIFERAIDPRTFSTAVREFRLVQRVFDSPSGRKRDLLGTVERLVTREPFSLVRSMSHRARPEDTSDFDNRDHRPWENPFTHEKSTASFWDLYDAARARVLPTVDELFSPDFDLAASRELTADLNFEGNPTEPGEKVAW